MPADIRPARARDVDALLVIENAVFRTDRLSRRSFLRLIESPSAAVLVTTSDECLAGYCAVLFREGVSVARLYSIAAAPRLAGRGAGRALLVAAEALASQRGCDVLRLEVREDNPHAFAFYERAGFLTSGRSIAYYQDGMAAIRMEKRLAADRPLADAAEERTRRTLP